jgi:TetR/AcrR family transcriptional regulator, transcriptional repressor for nem operon
LEKSWALMLTGMLRPSGIDYFRQFLRRRTALAINSSSSGADPS